MSPQKGIYEVNKAKLIKVVYSILFFLIIMLSYIIILSIDVVNKEKTDSIFH